MPNRVQRTSELGSLARQRMSDDKTVPFSSEDKQMEAAISEAKANFKQFIEAFCHPTERQKSFLVKVVFDEGEQREHI